VKIDDAARRSIDRAIDSLRQGLIIAIPTDTVYGLAASLCHPAAIEAIFDVKGRESMKAIPVLVDDPSRLQDFCSDVPDSALRLAERFWPGDLTLVMRASDRVPEAVHRGTGTVGLRMPANDIALQVIAGVGGGLAVTSANRSGEVEARSADEVRSMLGSRVAYVLDGGPSQGGIPSTVVDLTGPEIRVLRQGGVLKSDLDRALTD
jgi:L-threonylcarbamoyladenylate synthase